MRPRHMDQTISRSTDYKAVINGIAYASTSCLCLRPEPAEGTRGKQRIDKAVKGRFNGGAPGALVPDGHLPERHRIGKKRGHAGKTEDREVVGAMRQRASGDIRGEDADHEDVNEPLGQV